MDTPNDFNNRAPRPRRPGPPGGGTTPFNRTGKLPQLPSGNPQQASEPQEGGMVVRLDPHAKPGEFNFVISGGEAVVKVPAAGGLVAESETGIPPQLYKAVDEVLGFIYGLDQQFENQGRRPRK